jgi:HK97 gp10 family phage protein
MSVTMKTTGLADLERAMDNLSKSAGKGVLTRSLKKAGTPMMELARSAVPTDKGSLAASMAISTKLAKRQKGLARKFDTKSSVQMYIGPSYDLGKGGRHGHLVEFGTKPHINKGKFAGSQHPGTAPQPFMRPAWDSDQAALMDRLGKELWAELEKANVRAAKKAAKG